MPPGLEIRTKIRPNIRPLRVAYFLPSDSADAARRAILLCCTQWGGIRNVLVPVRPDGVVHPVLQHVLRMQMPDRFVSYLPTDGPWQSATDSLQRWLAAEARGREVRLEPGDGYESRDNSLHALSAVPRGGSDRPAGDAAGSGPTGPPLVIREFGGPPEDELFLLAAFGRIYPGQERHYEEEIACRHEATGFDDPTVWRSQADDDHRASVVNLTGYGFAFRRVENPSNDVSHTVVVAAGPEGVCLYWNLRAVRGLTASPGEGRRTWLLPRHRVGPEALGRLVDTVRRAPAPPGVSSDLDLQFVPHETADYEAVERAMASVGNVERITSGKVSVSLWSGQPDRRPREADTDRVIRYAFTFPRLPARSEEGVRPFPLAARTDLTPGPNEILIEFPDGFAIRRPGAYALDLETDLWQRYPRDPAVTGLVWPNSWISPYGLTAAVDWWPRPTYVGITVPTDWEALRSYFARRKYDIRLSANGRYGLGLLDLIGGLEQLSALATPTAYLLVDSLALKSSKKVAQKLKAAFERLSATEEDLARLLADTEVVPELKRVPKTAQQLVAGLKTSRKDVLQLLTRLIELDVVRRGVHAECPRCDVPSWHPLQGLSEKLTCPGCMAEFVLPAERPPGSGLELAWEYTLNTLVNRAVDQDVLPHLLAAYHLTRSRRAAHVFPGVEFVTPGEASAKAEFDFLFVTDSALVAGECKAGAILGEKDLQAARFAADLGVAEFYFCTVREFTPEARDAIEAVAADLKGRGSDIKVGVLDGDRLLGKAVS
jgi:hypothetical protein